MQRISVDLPEPEGPQITMRSPRRDIEVDVAQHVKIAVPFVEAGNADDRVLRSWSFAQLRWCSVQPVLDEQGIARHSKTEDRSRSSR